MQLNSDRLVLDEISWQDLKRIHFLHSIPEVDEYNTLGIPKDIEQTREIIAATITDQENENRSRFEWICSEKESSEMIGMCGMFLSAARFKSAEIYFKLAPGFWGKGYGTEIARTLVLFGFDTLKLHRIDAGVATENVRSIHLLEKLGMQREGLHREILPIRGEWKDNYHYAILENDPRDY